MILRARVVGVTNDVMPGDGKHYVTIFVEAEYAGGEVRILEPHKTTEVQWCELESLPEPLFIPLENFVKNNRLL